LALVVVGAGYLFWTSRSPKSIPVEEPKSGRTIVADPRQSVEELIRLAKENVNLGAAEMKNEYRKAERNKVQKHEWHDTISGKADTMKASMSKVDMASGRTVSATVVQKRDPSAPKIGATVLEIKADKSITPKRVVGGPYNAHKKHDDNDDDEKYFTC
jgi:hypothetical protein